MIWTYHLDGMLKTRADQDGGISRYFYNLSTVGHPSR
jgi:hypothetical protein